MSFGIADLVAVVVVEKRLEHLRNNPEHLNFILAPFCDSPEMRKKVGAEYISHASDLILNNRLYVNTFYDIDQQKLPNLSFSARTEEDQQFIGDYGMDIQTSSEPPIVYSSFDVSGIDKDVLKVPKAAKIRDSIWTNIIVSNGEFLARVVGISDKGSDTLIVLDRSVPSGTPFKDWKGQSSTTRRMMSVNSSIDNATVFGQLITTGDYGIHRLMANVVRYCLKSGRKTFEFFGLQTPRISQSQPSLLDDTNKTFSTSFTISTKLTEHWIVDEYNSGDTTQRFDVKACVDELE